MLTEVKREEGYSMILDSDTGIVVGHPVQVSICDKYLPNNFHALFISELSSGISQLHSTVSVQRVVDICDVLFSGKSDYSDLMAHLKFSLFDTFGELSSAQLLLLSRIFYSMQVSAYRTKEIRQ